MLVTFPKSREANSDEYEPAVEADRPRCGDLPTMARAIPRESVRPMRAATSRTEAASRNTESNPIWKINGFPAVVYIWTAEEWACLMTRPADARQHPSGVWCALRWA